MEIDESNKKEVAILYFRNELALACSFLEAGDEVHVDKIILESNPSFRINDDSLNPILSIPKVLVVPTEATVVVRSKQGDEILQLTLRPGHLDTPEARILPLDRSVTCSSKKVYCNATNGMGKALPE